ncbi:flagellar basal body-associated FliL family protein [Actinomadura algeriensis]|uniref:Uncharacterized protein n=1 Tax=Actinomadura algeriensis TaxID=1679523 RepID=A0ABR9JLB7_9ACTN|nr:hypothetical protein [Actinomadura algeriensis]MBE1531351.1 hypothetical protein [Actinomadura algeriensis]
MSDQGERDVRWTGLNESDAPHDVWGKIETPAESAAETPAEPSDVRVAPEPDAPQWEDELLDEDDAGEGVSNYVPAVPTGSTQPAKPGKPSSGNWQMPDWMADEAAADEKLGAAGDSLESGGRSRVLLFGGIGLVAALIAAGAVYFLTRGGGDEPDEAGRTGAAQQSVTAQASMPPDAKLETFTGTPSRVLGRVNDDMSGLSYPRLAAPWQVPTKENKLGTPGWSGQQIVVTEEGAQLWYGQLLTGTLIPSLHASYTGPDSVKSVAGLAAEGYLAQYYGFQDAKKPLASQALDVDGRKGWLVASYLTYEREGVRATGEIVATAVIDTGRDAPAVVFASLPNTHKKLWPDLNRFLGSLKVI